MHLPRIGLALGGFLLFLCGIAVGQKARPSKLTYYQQPASISKMDWLLLQAEVTSLKILLPYDNGIAPPSFSFDPDTNKVVAVAMVSAKQLEAEPAGEVRHQLQESAITAQGTVHFYVQNLSNRDFVMEFRAFGDKVKEAGKGYYLYAEYKDGELVMH